MVSRLEDVKKRYHGSQIDALDDVQWLIEVAEAAQVSVINMKEGVNVGVYRHLSNGDTAIDGDNWHRLNDLFNK